MARGFTNFPAYMEQSENLHVCPDSHVWYSAQVEWCPVCIRPEKRSASQIASSGEHVWRKSVIPKQRQGAA